MEVKAVHKFARVSPQKARLVANQIRGMSVDNAINLLTYSPKKSAVLIKKVLASAIANAENNQGADVDELKVGTIVVDEAASIKRWRARAKGRSTKIEKRNCHITVVVSDKSGVSQ